MSKIIKVATPLVGEEEVQVVREVLLSGYYTSGEKVKQFENNFSEYIGTKYGIATNSGTSALHIALASIGIGPGDEVIVPSLTFFSTATSIIHQNAIPIFADIDPETYCIDPNDLENKITEKTKAIIPVHLYGHPAEMDAIMDIAEEHNLTVIEDCAQAHGAEYKGKKVGSIGHIGCFSFFATKNMTTGEGGMITTNNHEIKDRAQMIRSHGMSSRHDHNLLGYNYRMSEINAAIGLVQLTKLEKLNQKRRENSEYLHHNLKGIDWLIIPKIKDYIKHAYFWCPVQIDEDMLGMKTQELIKLLREKGVEVRHRYTKPLYKQKMLLELNAYPKQCPFTCNFYGKEIDYSKVYCINVEQIAGKIIGLPNHPKLTKDELNKVVEVIKDI